MSDKIKKEKNFEYTFGTNRGQNEFALIISSEKPIKLDDYIQDLYDWADYHKDDMKKLIASGIFIETVGQPNKYH